MHSFKSLLILFISVTLINKLSAINPGNAPLKSAEDTPVKTLDAAGLSVGGELDLVTTSIFSGSIEPKKGNYWNIAISSTLAASRSSEGDRNRYQDACTLLPNGGVLNLIITPQITKKIGPTVTAENYAAVASTAKFGRGNAADRYYFKSKPDGNLDKSILEQERVAYYVNYGVGAKMLSREIKGADSSSVSSYGAGGCAYLGLGADGGMPSRDKTKSTGNFRIEFWAMAAAYDKKTIKSLYPEESERKNQIYSGGLNIFIAANDSLTANIQMAIPLASSQSFTKKLILIGLSVTR